MNKDQKQFLFCLRLLYKLIQDNDLYSYVFDYIREVKRTKNPKTFNYFLEDGSKLYLLQRIFETQSPTITNLVILDIIEQLTVQFSVLVGLNNVQWSTLIDHVIHAHYRIYSAKAVIDSKEIQQDIEKIHEIISANPWTLMILIIEILPKSYNALIFEETNHP